MRAVADRGSQTRILYYQPRRAYSIVRVVGERAHIEADSHHRARMGRRQAESGGAHGGIGQQGLGSRDKRNEERAQTVAPRSRAQRELSRSGMAAILERRSGHIRAVWRVTYLSSYSIVPPIPE
jgi:ribosomal protein L15